MCRANGVAVRSYLKYSIVQAELLQTLLDYSAYVMSHIALLEVVSGYTINASMDRQKDRSKRMDSIACHANQSLVLQLTEKQELSSFM